MKCRRSVGVLLAMALDGCPGALSPLSGHFRRKVLSISEREDSDTCSPRGTPVSGKKTLMNSWNGRWLWKVELVSFLIPLQSEKGLVRFATTPTA